jgi:hypothetical protein
MPPQQSVLGLPQNAQPAWQQSQFPGQPLIQAPTAPGYTGPAYLPPTPTFAPNMPAIPSPLLAPGSQDAPQGGYPTGMNPNGLGGYVDGFGTNYAPRDFGIQAPYSGPTGSMDAYYQSQAMTNQGGN